MMTDPKLLHFFDIASNLTDPRRSWSPNTLKTRMVLNFKGIPYSQSWTSFADITPLMRHLGAAPNEVGTAYTHPAICHESLVSTSNPTGVMMDSLLIAMHLEKCYPSPSLFPSGDASYALLVAVGKIMGGMAQSLRRLVPPRIPTILDPRGKECFIQKRTETFGRPLDEVRPRDEKSLNELWAQIETQLNAIASMLRGRPGKIGPFFEGDKLSYADIILVSAFASFYVVDHELWKKIMAVGHGELRNLWHACLPWIEGQGVEREWPVPE